MARGWRSKQKARQSEEYHGSGEAVVFISSDDDEANEDLSLKIVNKCRLRELKRKRDEDKEKVQTFFHYISSSSADEIAAIPNGTATGVSEKFTSAEGKKVKKKRKKKSKKKKGKEIEEEAETEMPSSPAVEVEPVLPVEVEPILPADSVVEVVNETSNDLVFRKLLRGPRYFDMGHDSWESCYNCGEEGHVASNCKEERRQKPCFVCGMFGHNAKNCMQGQDCFICKGKGHHAKDCPHKHEDNSQPIICMRCGDLGHDMASCRNGYATCDLKEIQCYICKKYGHLCCVDYSDDGPGQVSCYNCAESGHTGQGCAKQRGENNTSTPSALCYSCGQEGHFARGCTRGPKSVKRYGESSTPKLRKDKGGHKASKLFRKHDGESSPRVSWSNRKKVMKVSKTSKSVIKRHGESSTPVRDKKHKKEVSKSSKSSKSLPKNYGRDHVKGSTYLDRSTRTVKSKVKGGWIVDDTVNLPKRKHMSNVWASPVTPSRRGNQNYSSASIGSYSSSHTPSARMYNAHTSSSGGRYSSPYTPHQRVNYYAGTPNSHCFAGGYRHGFSGSRFGNSYDYYW